jgi:murein DD-endopeptidase MepM/ murein hydrolase activator NlpD
MQLGRPDSKPRNPLRKLALLGALAFAVLLGLALLRVGPAPSIAIEPERKAIGRRTPVVVKVEEPRRGLAGVRAELVQGDTRATLAEKRFAPRPFWSFWGPRTAREELRFEVGRETVPGLKAGEAAIVVTAERTGTWLRRPAPAVAQVALPVRLAAPSLAVLSNHTYAAQGGAEAVVYRVGEHVVRHGVQSGPLFFPGHPLPGGGPSDRFALFAVPYDMPDAAAVRLVAEDDAGNQSTAAFVERFFPRPPKTDKIELDDRFLSKVVPEIMAQTPELQDQGGLLANYLQINGELRRRNAAALRELAASSRPEFLWRESFLAMPNAQVMSAFADRRTYFYGGKEVDRQDHLGFDLAVTRQAPVPAANSGIVVLARYFGIYGNAVVVDHGYGLQSLYAHLSSLAVKEGDRVERGQELGRSGETGLAGGDHLHFTTLLQGLPVNPIEWWDAHWLQDRLKTKLGKALPYGEEASEEASTTAGDSKK